MLTHLLVMDNWAISLVIAFGTFIGAYQILKRNDAKLSAVKQGTATSLNLTELRDPSLGWRAEDPDWEALERLGRERGWPEARWDGSEWPETRRDGSGLHVGPDVRTMCRTTHVGGMRCPKCPPRFNKCGLCSIAHVDGVKCIDCSPLHGRTDQGAPAQELPPTNRSSYRWGEGWDGPGRPAQVRDVVFGDEPWASASEVITIAGPPCAVRGCADAACAEAVAAHVALPPRIRSISEINAGWERTATGAWVLEVERQQSEK